MNLPRFAKLTALRLAKLTGVFRLVRRATRGRLRILCYHGFAIDDEIDWRGPLFISQATFGRRVRHLRQAGYRVLPLGDAVSLLRKDRLPANAVVITIDDGFASTKSIAHTLLSQAGFPYTIYVPTYYVDKETPIFNLALSYMLWKTEATSLNLAEVAPGLSGLVDLKSRENGRLSYKKLLDWGEAREHADRVQLMRRLGEALGVSYEELARSRKLTLMHRAELEELAAAGVDLQLHTHRHRWPRERNAASDELHDNRCGLEPIAGRELRHLCYPSGVFHESQYAYLEEAGIESAVTCEAGLANATTCPYALPRYLDCENVTQIEFEAMLAGVDVLLARIRQWATGARKQEAAVSTSLNPAALQEVA